MEVPWSTLHLGELLCTFLSYAAPYLVILRSWTALHTVELYAAPYWATLQPTDIHSILFLSYAAPSELHFTLWATLHPTELSFILISYTTPYWATPRLYPLLSYAAPCWATPHTHCNKLSYAEPCWTTLHLLNNAAPYWAPGHSTELRFILLSYTVATLAHPNWATLHPTELCSTPLSFAAPCELHYILTELPTVLVVPLCNFL